MRIFTLVLIGILFFPLTTPFAIMTVFELSNQIKEITQAILDTWNVITIIDHTNLTKTDQNKKERLMLSRLDKICLQVDEINVRLHGTGDDLNILVRMLSNLPDTIRLELNLNGIRTNETYINDYYKRMENYVMDYENYENPTLLEFANSVVSDRFKSVMEMIHQHVIRKDFLELFFKQLKPGTKNYFCQEKQSLPQMLHSFLNEIIIINAKSSISILIAYMIKQMYTQDNFVKEFHKANEEFRTRSNSLIQAVKPYIAKGSSELWRCDPEKHVQDQTFVEITNFLHGYILNKANLDPNGKCRDECDVFNDTKTQRCVNNGWCQRQTTCPKVINCQYVDSSMTVCSKSMTKDNRRYEYIEFGNGRVFGKKNSCSQKSFLETYKSWIVWGCSYCFCICDEGQKHFSDRYINMRAARSNYDANRVVTGVRFVKHNQIIHLQVQEGELLSHGQIDLDSVRWVPPEDYSITDINIYEGQDYHTLSWERRGFDLSDTKVEEGHIILGVKLKNVATRIHLEVLTTSFNFTTGQLNLKRGYFQNDSNLVFENKFDKELKLDRPDIPTRSQSQHTEFSTNTYVQFTHTDFDKDAAQTTVPFFDAQPVYSAIPVPLSGVGIFHKGGRESGGFLAPRIFTYNFTQHLEHTFSGTSNEN